MSAPVKTRANADIVGSETFLPQVADVIGGVRDLRGRGDKGSLTVAQGRMGQGKPPYSGLADPIGVMTNTDLYAHAMSVQDPYRRIAGVYDRLIEPMQSGVRRIALDVVPPQPEWQVLDVGCGTGTGLAQYAGTGCSVVGVDVSAAMLDKAAARLGDEAELHLTDGDNLPFDDGRFDLVTTSMVLHEVPADAREQFVTEMARVTKSGGRMLLIDFRFGPLRGWKGPLLRAVSSVMERFSGHYSGYRSFKASGGVLEVVERVGHIVEREKIVAGGNVAIYVVAP